MNIILGRWTWQVVWSIDRWRPMKRAAGAAGRHVSDVRWGSVGFGRRRNSPVRLSHRPAYPTYERLLQSRDVVSLRAIVDENPMLRFAVDQEIRHGRVRIVGFSRDAATGVPTDVWLRLRGRFSPVLGHCSPAPGAG